MIRSVRYKTYRHAGCDVGRHTDAMVASIHKYSTENMHADFPQKNVTHGTRHRSLHPPPEAGAGAAGERRVRATQAVLGHVQAVAAALPAVGRSLWAMGR